MMRSIVDAMCSSTKGLFQNQRSVCLPVSWVMLLEDSSVVSEGMLYVGLHKS